MDDAREVNIGQVMSVQQIHSLLPPPMYFMDRHGTNVPVGNTARASA